MSNRRASVTRSRTSIAYLYEYACIGIITYIVDNCALLYVPRIVILKYYHKVEINACTSVNPHIQIYLFTEFFYDIVPLLILFLFLRDFEKSIYKIILRLDNQDRTYLKQFFNNINI